jgi:hypothetical protein
MRAAAHMAAMRCGASPNAQGAGDGWDGSGDIRRDPEQSGEKRPKNRVLECSPLLLGKLIFRWSLVRFQTRPTTAESRALKLGTLVLDGVVELPMRARAVVSFNYVKAPFTVGYLIKRYRYEARGLMKSVLDASFKYTPSFETDVRKTFHRVRRRQVQTSGHVQVTNSQCELKDAVLTLQQFKKSRAY